MLREEFPVETRDEEWIREIGRRGWVLVTIDHYIKAKPHERQSLQESRVTAFFLDPGFANMKLDDYTTALIKVWSGIKEAAQRAQPGEIYHVTVGGTVKPFSLRK